jgi:uncharacterized protein (TIGR02284 family)
MLETTKDGASGFRTCAGAVMNTDLKTVFEDAARRCDEGATELQAKIPQPRRGTGVVRHGERHASPRLDQRQVFTSMDEYAVLTECERGEDVAKRTYEEALIEDLPADVKAIVQRQYEGVKANHARIRSLRDGRSSLNRTISNMGLSALKKGGGVPPKCV